MTTNARDEKWSEWKSNHGKHDICPVKDGTKVDYKMRDGDTQVFDYPEQLRWQHEGIESDIIAYRYKIKEPESMEVTDAEEEAWQAKERELIGGPRKAENFLMQAAELLAERGKQYDQPGGERSMGKTMGAFNIITGRDLTEAEGWLIMTLLKRVRQYSGQGYHKDSAEDGVTYGALEAEALESAG